MGIGRGMDDEAELLRQYLREIGRIPPLTPDAEVALARRLVDGQQSERAEDHPRADWRARLK